MKKRTGLLVLVFVLSALGVSAENVFKITNKVRLENPQRFGINFEVPTFASWHAQSGNVWNNGYSCEPIEYRHNTQATGGGKDYVECKKGKQKSNPRSGGKDRSAGAGYWEQYTDGFWDGAEINFYREDGHTLRHIRRDTVKNFSMIEDKIYLENSGEPIQQGDVFEMHMTRLKIPELQQETIDYVLKNGKGKPAQKVQSLKEARKFQLAPGENGVVSYRGAPPEGMTWELDDTTFAPEAASTASLKVGLPGGSLFGVGHQFLRWGGKEINFQKGKPYQCDIWLRQEGLSTPVVLQIGDRGTHKINVGDEWEKFSFEVPSDTPITEGIGHLFVGSKSEGTIWIDNFLIYRTDIEPFAIHQEWIDILKEWKPSVLRSFSGHNALTLDGFLSHGFSKRWIGGPSRISGSSATYSLHQQLTLCEEVGAVPWLMLHVLYTDEEIDQFMEYIGAPADTGYGKLRAEHGHPQPWTEVFEKIYVECGNEIWNSVFKPQAFPRDPKLAGRMANRLFLRLKESKWNQLEKIRGMCPARAHFMYKKVLPNGREYVSWTMRAVEECTAMDAMAGSPSGYIGGWDGFTRPGVDDEELFQSNLFYPRQIFEPRMEEVTNLRKHIFDLQNREFEMFKYEAGPGYPLPNPKKPFMEEAEIIGKSLATGIACLDNFLFNMANNGNSCYFKLRAGNNWSSHNLDMIPHADWLALGLRNKYCQGALLEVEEQDLNTVDLPEMKAIGLNNSGKPVDKTIEPMPDTPYVRLYAFREGSRWSIIALNRHFTEPQTVTIQVPYTPESTYTTYTLAHEDPRTNNRDGENVKVEEKRRTGFTKKFEFTLEPASAVVFVNHEQ